MLRVHPVPGWVASLPVPRAEWEGEAANWLLWARTPGHDAYWSFKDSFFETIVPPPGRRTLEIGCGEGRVARDLRAQGHRVVGVDLAPTLLRSAREADTEGSYAVADARALPFPHGAFDTVVAYNSLMDVDGMAAAVREAARVLAPGGSLCICVTHPLNDVGAFSDDGRTFVISEPYLNVNRFEATFERDGLTMTFRGWTHPLEDYAKALEAAGLHVARLREPVPASTVGEYAAWTRVPMFLHLRAVKAD